MPVRISVPIVACNEAANLRRTLASVAWVDEIVLVDSGSTDETLEIAREFNARIFVEPWKGTAPGQLGDRQVTGDWILALDADEVVTPELRRRRFQTTVISGGRPNSSTRIWIPRLNLVLGRWMRHGGVYPDPKLRLFRRGTARLREDTEPHATPKWDGPTGRLKSHMLHYAYPNLDVYLEHMVRYSTASIPLVLGKGKTSRSLPAFVVEHLPEPGRDLRL